MKILLFIMALLNCLLTFPQTELLFKSLRYEEDYSSIKTDTTGNIYNKIKFVPLSKSKKTYLSIGGEARLQFFYIHNENWGDARKIKDSYVLSRFLTHTDFHSGKNFRAFFQLQSSLSFSRIDASPVDQNPLELHQAFADVKTNLSNSISIIFRFGRQELLYGSQRLIAVREGPNNRQSFDAIRSLIIGRNYKADFFYSHQVAAKKKIFDDRFNRDTKLWGIYIVRNKLPALKNMDLYYLGFWKSKAQFDDGQGRERRHSIGSRIWKNSGNLNYDIEALYQFGKFSNRRIAAWTSSINVSYHFTEVKWKPEIGLKTELISGDKNSGDLKLQTFNPLFPRGAYFGLAALIGPANLMDIHPAVSLSFTKSIAVGFDYDIFWRYSRTDGLYAINGTLIYSGRTSRAKYIGSQPAINISYSPNKFINLSAEFTWFAAGTYLKDVGSGNDIVFTGVTTQVKF